MSSPSDIEGVSNLKVASMLGLVVQAMIWVGFGIFYLIFTALTATTTSFGTGRVTPIPSWITPGTFYLAIGLIAGGLVIGIVSYIFFYLGFRAIKRGAPDFGAPTTLVAIGLIGFAMMALGIIVIVGIVISAINNATSGAVSSGSASLDVSALFGGGALIALGALLALIGVIGLILGNWRAGGRYGESMLKIGAIITILPYVSIVGYVLLLIGYFRAGSKLASGWVPPTVGMGGPYAGAPYMPPPGQQPPAWQAPPPPPPPA
jgi:hypothetical protein